MRLTPEGLHAAQEKVAETYPDYEASVRAAGIEDAEEAFQTVEAEWGLGTGPELLGVFVMGVEWYKLQVAAEQAEPAVEGTVTD